MFAQFTRRTVMIAVGIAVASAGLIATPTTTHAASAPLTIPIAGTVTKDGQAVGTFTGTLNLTSFANQDGRVVATGLVTGILNAGGTTTSIVQSVATPVHVGNTPAPAAQAAAVTAQPTTGSCSILHLDLNPIHLNLLGLRVDTSQIVVDISAEPGPGNLLGNLLCSVTGLLDSPGGLSRLLNQILGVLG